MLKKEIKFYILYITVGELNFILNKYLQNYKSIKAV